MAIDKKKWTQEYLDPASRLGEVLFGLIMVLSITLTADVAAGKGRAEARPLLAAALGCNIAWGIIDAIMYILNCLAIRSERLRLARDVQSAADDGAALGIIRQRLGPEFALIRMETEREAIFRALLHGLRQAEVVKVQVTSEDIRGALVCFWLVFLSCLPATLPFLLIKEPTLALRCSNGLLLLMLFAVGYKWAKHTGAPKVFTGTAMVGVGMALVGVAVLLGG